jgi:hypothetical protein
MWSLYSAWSQPGYYRTNLYEPPAEFDTLYTKLTTNIMSDEERYADVRTITDMWTQDMPTAPLFQTADFLAARTGINFNAHPQFFIDLRPDNFSL